jgi:hypothetical protein
MRSSLSPSRVAATFILALAVAACSSSKHQAGAPSSSASPSASASASAAPSSGASASSGSSFAPAPGSPEATIQQNWQKFFDGKTSADQKVALLQNGAQFQQVISAQAGSALAKSSGATVSNVVVQGSQATVTYTVTLGGQPALPDQKGQAVMEGGSWKVSDASFCQLLVLENGGNSSGLPPACAAGAGSSSPAG